MAEVTKKPRTRKAKTPIEPEIKPVVEVAEVVQAEPKYRKHNAYMHFQSTQRARLLEEDPTLRMTQISKLVSPLWHALTDEERADWKKQAEALPEILVEPKPPKRKRKGKRDPDAPKRKPTSFNNYFRLTQGQVREANPGILHTQVLGEVTKEWKKLTKEQQDEWKDK